MIRARENNKRHLRIWSAGCSTGEEAYSIAILFKEQLVGKYSNVIVKIFATDIDAIALDFAGKGIYSDQNVKNISPERLERYFSKQQEGYKITAQIRDMMIFAHHDLVKNPPYCNMHFISCRNLLIYMTPALQKKIFLMLLFGLRMEGYLFLGSSENPLSIIDHLEVSDKKWKIYKNIERKWLFIATDGKNKRQRCNKYEWQAIETKQQFHCGNCKQ